MSFFEKKNAEKNKHKKVQIFKNDSHPPVHPARERAGRLREDSVDDPVGQTVVAVAEEVLFREEEVVVGVELLRI